MRKLFAKLVLKCLNSYKNVIDYFSGMIQRQKTIQELETLVPCIQKKFQDTEVIKQSAGICIQLQTWNFACRVPVKGYNHLSKESTALHFSMK
jgi:hypothetical protein